MLHGGIVYYYLICGETLYLNVIWAHKIDQSELARTTKLHPLQVQEILIDWLGFWKGTVRCSVLNSNILRVVEYLQFLYFLYECYIKGDSVGGVNH